MRPPFVLSATAATTALALTLAACSGSADEERETASTSSSPSSTSPSSTSSSTTAERTVEITGAPASLSTAIATKYGSRSVKGTATTGTWRGAKVAIVDELGGLNFIAPKAMRSHLTGGTITKGYNHLDGTEALAWSRERKTLPGGDFDRSRNQGLLLAAAAIQARLRGPEALPEALSVIDEEASSNLSAEDMLMFTAAFYRVKPTQIGHEVAKGPTGMQSGQSIVRLDSDSRDAFRDFRDGRLS